MQTLFVASIRVSGLLISGGAGGAMTGAGGGMGVLGV